MSDAPTETVAQAVELFSAGRNCAQAVFTPHAAASGIEAEAAAKMTSMFGAGIVRTGQLCGACSGALLALGLRMGDGAKPGALGKDFLARFAERHGSTTCRVLLGHDISTEEGLQRVRDLGLRETACLPLVRSAAELVVTLLAEQEPAPAAD